MDIRSLDISQGGETNLGDGQAQLAIGPTQILGMGRLNL
jgi:hypothetical protein